MNEAVGAVSASDGRRVLQLLGPSSGGIRRHVAALAAGLSERGWIVEVAGPPGVMAGLRPLDHQLAIGRSPRTALPLSRAVRRLSRSFDLVHAHGLTAATLAGFGPRRRPLVVSVHNLVLDAAEGRTAPWLRRVEDCVPSRADATIATSEEVARRFTGLRGAGRITVIPPVGLPVEQSDAPDLRAELGAGPTTPLVVLVGRLHPQKDIGSLLEATVELAETHPHLVVAIAGDGPERATLTDRARRLGVEGHVRFVGQRDDIGDLLAAADVVVMCSIWESYGFVVAEALSLARPVVATAVGAVPQLVIDGLTGRLVPPSDPPALASAVGALLDDPALAARLGRAGAAHVVSRPCAAAGIERIAEVYLDVLERR